MARKTSALGFSYPIQLTEILKQFWLFSRFFFQCTKWTEHISLIIFCAFPWSLPESNSANAKELNGTEKTWALNNVQEADWETQMCPCVHEVDCYNLTFNYSPVELYSLTGMIRPRKPKCHFWVFSSLHTWPDNCMTGFLRIVSCRQVHRTRSRTKAEKQLSLRVLLFCPDIDKGNNNNKKGKLRVRHPKWDPWNKEFCGLQSKKHFL